MDTYYDPDHKLWKVDHVRGIFILGINGNQTNISKSKSYCWYSKPLPNSIESKLNKALANQNSKYKKNRTASGYKHITKPIFGFKTWQLFVNYCLIFSTKVFICKSRSTNSVYVEVNKFKVRFSDHPAKSTKKFNSDAKSLWDAIKKYRKAN